MSESLIISRQDQNDPVAQHSDLTDLNPVIARVLDSLRQPLLELKPIIRQDAIAIARGNENDFTVLFTHVLEIILKHPPQEGKLFIYIRSVQNDPAGDDKIVTVSIHTNTAYDTSWEKTYANVLSECGDICKRHGGGFVYHMVSNTSCLFTINLQGK